MVIVIEVHNNHKSGSSGTDDLRVKVESGGTCCSIWKCIPKL